jgi:hypothetical protein
MYKGRGLGGRDCMVVGFTITCVISAYHHGGDRGTGGRKAPKVILSEAVLMYSFKMAFVACTLCNLNIPEIIISYIWYSYLRTYIQVFLWRKYKSLVTKHLCTKAEALVVGIAWLLDLQLPV